jgi:hypothetical protein
MGEELDKITVSLDNTDRTLTSTFLGQIARRKLAWIYYVGLTYPATVIGKDLVWNGTIDGVEIDEQNILIDILSPLASAWRKKVPGRIYQATCPWIFEPLLAVTDVRKGIYCKFIPPELCPDGDFAAPGSWIVGADWSIGGGVASKAATGATTLSYNCGEAAGEKYRVSYIINSISGGPLTMSIGGVAGTARTVAGTYEEDIQATGAGNLTFTGDALTVCAIDSVNVNVIWCDQSYKRCEDLGNTDNFGGFRWLPYLLNRSFKWGPEKLSS